MDASRALRRLPSAIKRQVKLDVREEVAEPLAARVKAAPTGPYARVISAGVKTKADVVPRIAVGGKRKAVSGGARVVDLVYGDEFGGGKRETVVTRPARNAARTRTGKPSAKTRQAARSAGNTRYRRRTTMQFVPPHPFLFPTVRRERAAMLEGLGRIIDRVLDQDWRS